MDRRLTVIVATVLVFVGVAALLLLFGSMGRGADGGAPLFGPRVAIVELEGLIAETDDLVRELRQHRDNPSVRAVVIRINSPGGVVAPTQEVYDALLRVREAGKPVVASLGAVAAVTLAYAHWLHVSNAAILSTTYLMVVLVVAANDSVMPQTVEAISHAKNAGVPLIVAINKIDLAEANPGKVTQDLLAHGVVLEQFGGQVLSTPISAKKGTGVKELLDQILLQSEILDLKSNPDRHAVGTVLEERAR